MALPKTILYPVDFTEKCREIWPAVAAMNGTLRAPLTMVHAFEAEWDDLSPTSARNVANEVTAIRERIEKRLAGFPGIEPVVEDIRREVMDGQAVECIVRRAAGMENPIIMMPTRGRTRFRLLLLGSVTAGVLDDSPYPVWTDAHQPGHEKHTGLYRSIVCAVDMGLKTTEVLRSAREFSEAFGSRLHVVHSVPGIDPRFPSALADRAHAFLVCEAQEKFPANREEAGLDVPLEIVEDVGLVDGILRVAAREKADLLVIGRGVMQGVLGRLRTNAHELIRRSRCPVLSV